MPINSPCNHLGCDGGPCKKLTPEELEPSEEDMRLAKELIAAGFMSTSNKYRHVSAFKEPLPKAVDLIAPDMLHTLHGQRMLRIWSRYQHSWDLRSNPSMVETRELTVKQFRAFKKAGGPSA